MYRGQYVCEFCHILAAMSLLFSLEAAAGERHPYVDSPGGGSWRSGAARPRCSPPASQLWRAARRCCAPMATRAIGMAFPALLGPTSIARTGCPQVLDHALAADSRPRSPVNGGIPLAKSAQAARAAKR